jgi:hypothetical protein
MFAECRPEDTQQSLLCRVLAIWHSAKNILKFLKNLCLVRDRGHSAKKRNKPPQGTFLLPSLISLSHCHPRAAVDSPPRRTLAAAPAPRRHRRASPSPSPHPRLALAVTVDPTHSHARRARRHRRRAVLAVATPAALAVPAPAALAVATPAVLAVPAAAPAVPLTRARRARRARARVVVPLATAAWPRVPSSPPREVYTFYASIHHVVVDLPSYSHLHHEAL